MEIKCKQCYTLFKTKESQVAQGKGIFCSRRCYGDWMKENKPKMWGVNLMSEERKALAREKSAQKKRGRSLSEEQKRKISETMKNKVMDWGFKKGEHLGEKHPRWKGGKWSWAKKVVLERDKNTCLYCGLKEEGLMDAAHIKGYEVRQQDRRKIIHNPEHLITLCPNCHRRYDLGRIKLQLYCSSKIPLKR